MPRAAFHHANEHVGQSARGLRVDDPANRLGRNRRFEAAIGASQAKQETRTHQVASGCDHVGRCDHLERRHSDLLAE